MTRFHTLISIPALISLLFMCHTSQAQNERLPLINFQSFQDTLLKVSATLTDSAVSYPYCGIAIVTATYTFEIDTVLAGSYFNKRIRIQFQCPREMGEAYFQKGRRYKMTVRKMPAEYFKIDPPGQTYTEHLPLYKYTGIF